MLFYLLYASHNKNQYIICFAKTKRSICTLYNGYVILPKKKISLIVRSKTLQFETSHLSLDKIFSFFFSHINSIYREQTFCI